MKEIWDESAANITKWNTAIPREIVLQWMIFQVSILQTFIVGLLLLILFCNIDKGGSLALVNNSVCH